MNTRRIAFIFICFFGMHAQAAEVYQSRDEDGNIVYTDVPPKDGGQKLKLPPVNIFKSQLPGNPDLESDANEEFQYQKLEILSPQNDETIFINTSNLAINVQLIPNVNQGAGHKLQILLNGNVLIENRSSYVLAEVDRGSHVIQARVIDKTGQSLIESAPVTVHIKQPFS